MAAIAVTTAVTTIPRTGRDKIIARNQGPGTLYVDTSSSVSIATGLPVLSGESITLDSAYQGTFYVTSDSTCDVRWMVVG